MSFVSRKKSITIKDVLMEAGDNLCMVLQWSNPLAISSQLKYYHKAECLVEMAEVMDCGSVGGFGSGQSTVNSYKSKHDGLFSRWAGLYLAYVDADPGNKSLVATKMHWATFANLKRFFKDKPYQ